MIKSFLLVKGHFGKQLCNVSSSLVVINILSLVFHNKQVNNYKKVVLHHHKNPMPLLHSSIANTFIY